MRTSRGWKLSAVSVAAATAAAIVFFGLRGGDLPRVGPEPANAAQIADRIASTLARTHSVRGVVTVRNREGTLGGIHTMRWSFALDELGNLRLEELPKSGVLVYDANAGREVTYSEDSDSYGDRRGLSSGPPDEGPGESILQRSLGSVVRALVAAGDVPVREVVFQGRPSWAFEGRASLRLVVPEERPIG